MDDPESWRWVWLLVVALCLIGEMLTPGSFFLLPFAIGALAACISAFFDAPVGVQWVLFVVVSAGTSAAFIPLRRRLDRDEPVNGVGSRRLLNQEAVVIRSVAPGPDGIGWVLIGREEWRAESENRVGIPEGAVVRVIDVRGTGVVVTPVRTSHQGASA